MYDIVLYPTEPPPQTLIFSGSTLKSSGIFQPETGNYKKEQLKK